MGGGTRIKIFEAMAMRKAIVSTSLGAEGLEVESGEHLLICDDPSGFSDCVVKLLEDRELRERIAETAVRMVREKFGAETVARQFETICQDAIRS